VCWLNLNYILQLNNLPGFQVAPTSLAIWISNCLIWQCLPLNNRVILIHVKLRMNQRVIAMHALQRALIMASTLYASLPRSTWLSELFSTAGDRALCEHKMTHWHIMWQNCAKPNFYWKKSDAHAELRGARNRASEIRFHLTSCCVTGVVTWLVRSQTSQLISQ
jgi:hypothetical protein